MANKILKIVLRYVLHASEKILLDKKQWKKSLTFV